MVNALALKESIENLEPQILDALGIEAKGVCPVHQGDNPTAFSYSFERRAWACWSHHCERTYGADIIGLVRGVKQCSFSDAIKWIVQELHVDPSTLNVDRAKRKQFIRNQTKKQKIAAAPQVFDIRPFLKASGPHTYFYERGFTESTLIDFGCFSCLGTPKALYNRAVVSVRNRNGDVFGMAGRQIGNSDEFCKWLYYPDTLPTSSLIGGLFESLKKYPGSTIALAEGYFDAMKIYQAGFPAGAILGTKIYPGQIKELIGAGIKKIFLLLDPDDAGRAASVEIGETLRKYFTVIDFTNKLANDPGDLSPEELQLLITELKNA